MGAGRKATLGVRYVARELQKLRPDLTQPEAVGLVYAMLSAIAEALQGGETVTLANFGTFTVRQNQARVKHDPRTLRRVNVPAKRVVRFKAARMLYQTVADLR